MPLGAATHRTWSGVRSTCIAVRHRAVTIQAAIVVCIEADAGELCVRLSSIRDDRPNRWAYVTRCYKYNTPCSTRNLLCLSSESRPS